MARVLRRGIWIILASTAVVTAVAIYLAQREPPIFQSSAQVLLKYENLASGISGIQGFVYQDPTRTAATQTQIAMSPAVARRVAAAKPIAGGAIGPISVVAATGSDLLYFTASWRDAPGAVALANEYARQYVLYRQTLDSTSLVNARDQLEKRVAELKASELRNSELVVRLEEQGEQLRTLEALRTANAVVLRPALGAAQIQPKPKRAAVLGVVLGLMLGIGLAFVRDALDTRVKSAREIGERLGLPLLARIPAPPRTLRSGHRLVMLSNRTGPEAEAFRMLRTNLDFVNLDRGARSIMLTSATEGEGKSTTIANLAIALMRAGQRVALVDLDLRRPSLDKFFGITGDAPGVTSVALGQVSLRKALLPVLGEDVDFARTPSNGEANGRSTAAGGTLTLLPSGPTPPDPGEFITNPNLHKLLIELTREFDIVLVDAPPLLSVGDAMALSGSLDAMIVLVRIGVVKRPTLEELRRALQTCPTVKLGYVATGAEFEEGYGYGGYQDAGYYGERAPAPSPEGTHV